MLIDATANKIIKNKYWKSGWRPEDQWNLSKNDFDYLNIFNLVFGNKFYHHDDLITEIKFLSSKISISECMTLFDWSISDGNVLNRSYLSSVLQGKQIPVHSHQNNLGRCIICGGHRSAKIDLDLLLFEKTMWGGVRLDRIEYIYFDLMLYNKFKKPSTGKSELNAILNQIDNLPVNLSASKVSSQIKLPKSNKAQRETFCGILGICEILSDHEHQGYLKHYTNDYQRELPNQHYIDLAYPFCWYNSKHKVNWPALKRIKMAQQGDPPEPATNAVSASRRFIPSVR